MKSYYQIYLSLVRDAMDEIKKSMQPDKAMSIDGPDDEVVSVLVNGRWEKSVVLFLDGGGLILSTYNGHDIELSEWAERASFTGDIFFLTDRIRGLDPDDPGPGCVKTHLPRGISELGGKE